MKKRGNPALLGLFVVAGLVLVFITLFSIAGGELFTRKVDTTLYAVGMIPPLDSIAPGASKLVESRLFVGPQEEKSLEYTED